MNLKKYYLSMLFIPSITFGNNTNDLKITGHFNSLNSEQTVQIVPIKNKTNNKSYNHEDEMDLPDQYISISDGNKIVLENKEFIPCTSCFGINGGYIYLKTNKSKSENQFDSFTISMESGAADRVMDSFTFRYDSKKYVLIGRDTQTISNICQGNFKNTSINYISNIKIITYFSCVNDDNDSSKIIKEKRIKIQEKPQFLETIKGIY